MFEINYIDHTADIGFEIISDNLEELFMGAIIEMFKNMVNIETVRSDECKTFSIDADNTDDLLFNTLKSFLDNYYMNGFIPVKADKVVIKDNLIHITAIGSYLKNADENIMKTEIKSVTYHKLHITKRNNKYNTSIIFDV